MLRRSLGIGDFFLETDALDLLDVGVVVQLPDELMMRVRFSDRRCWAVVAANSGGGDVFYPCFFL